MWPQKKRESPTPEVAADGIFSAAPSRQQSPQPYHRPNTGQDEQHVYVLTLSLTPSISVPLNQMREEYFPKNLNRTPAHITLFHALPHSQIDAIDADLNRITGRTRPYHISTGTAYRMQKGVAVLLGSGNQQTCNLREELREKWFKWLSQQDTHGRGWQPHWTVMNKVEEEKKVKAAFHTLRRILFEDVHHGKALGFDLWKYCNGKWEHAKEYRFRGHETSSVSGPDGEKKPPRPKSRGNAMKSAEGGLKKTNSWTRMGDVWKTVTLAKKSSKPEVER